MKPRRIVLPIYTSLGPCLKMCVTDRETHQGHGLGRRRDGVEATAVAWWDVVARDLQKSVDRRWRIAGQDEGGAVAEIADCEWDETGGEGLVASHFEDQALHFVAPAPGHRLHQLPSQVLKLLWLWAVGVARVVAKQEREECRIELFRSSSERGGHVAGRDFQRTREQKEALVGRRQLVQLAAHDEGRGISVDRHTRCRRDVRDSNSGFADAERFGDSGGLVDQYAMNAGWTAKSPRTCVERQHLVERMLAKGEEATNGLWQARWRDDVVDGSGKRKLRCAP